MQQQSYQYGPLPTGTNNNNDNGSGHDSYSDGQDFDSFQRGLEEMYKSPGPGEGNYGRWNIYMVGCIFIAFLFLLSGTHRHAHVKKRPNHNNRVYHNGQNVPVTSPQTFGMPTPTPTYQEASKYLPKTAPAVIGPSPSTSTSAHGNNPHHESTGIKKIHLLMAFPMSGVSYTFRLFSSLTNELTLGTNNGITDNQPILFEDKPNGPYLYELEGNNVDIGNTFLVMTHCGSHCPDESICGGHEEETIWSFDTECRVTSKPDAHASGPTLHIYDRSLVDYSRTIHLVRDPLANLVSLFHLAQYTNDQYFIRKYPNNKDGYFNWCKDQTTPPEDWWILGDFLVKEHVNSIPCFFQLFQYVQWHMLTYQLHGGKGHIIRFEDYGNGNEIKAGTSAMQYLQIPTVNTKTVPEFRGANMYKDYYSKEQSQLMWDLIKNMSPTTQIYEELFQVYNPNK